MFFSKKSEVKCESEPEIVKPSKQEHHHVNLKEEQNIEDAEEKFTEGKKDHVEAVTWGIKREFQEETETNSGPTSQNMQSKHDSPVKKKGKSMKNAGDKQSSLLSYFGKR